MGVFLGLLKKKTREESLVERTENVFMVLTGNSDIEITELEMIQTMNNARRMLVEHLESKKGLLMEQSVTNSQKAKEIGNALGYVE